MKQLLLMATILGSLLTGACQKSSSPGSGNTPAGTPDQSKYAATPQPCNVNTSTGSGYFTYNPNCPQYNQWYINQNPQSWIWQYGSWYWPYSYTYSSPNCACPQGYFPVQGPFGLACAPQAYYTTSLVFYNWGYWGGAYWNYPQNTGGLNIPQVYYMAPQNQTGNCSQQIAQGCDVRLNNCGSGATCVAIAGGSTIGLCVR